MSVSLTEDHADDPPNGGPPGYPKAHHSRGHCPICLETVRISTTVINEAVYAAAENEALARSRRDPDDWPAVACALMLSAGIWTNDNDYLGTGIPTWTTETLRVWLDRNPRRQ